MKASVIIPNLNGAGWLRDSIESVWAQTEQDFELIVIDDFSTDETAEISVTHSDILPDGLGHSCGGTIYARTIVQ